VNDPNFAIFVVDIQNAADAIEKHVFMANDDDALARTPALFAILEEVRGIRALLKRPPAALADLCECLRDAQTDLRRLDDAREVTP